MPVIVIDHDFETFCELNIRLVGAYRYAQHESCDVLCLSWGTCEEDLRTWCPHEEPEMPDDLLALCNDPSVIFQAHNAQFEHVIWKYVMRRRYGAPVMRANRFRCTAARAAACGLPRALDKVGAALNLAVQKDKDGARLIRKFCVLQPARKPSKKNPDGIPPRRIFPDDEPEEFAKMVSYNRTDVLTELLVAEHTPPLPRREQEYYVLDLQMNTRGIPLDMPAVNAAMPVLTDLENRVVRRVMELTGGVRPTQRDKMLAFLNGLGLDLENLQAKTLKDLLLLRKKELTDKQIELLQLRVEGGKASTKKLKKMLQVVCADGRVRGAFLYGGAHTLRWAGKLIQPQNFTRGEYKPWQLEMLFAFIMMSDADILELLYEWPIDAIAQGMRGFIKTAKKFVVCDFSAIEARMLAWLANEVEMLKVYHANGDVYIRMATKLYHIAEDVLIDLCKVKFDPKALLQRKFAKDLVLGCGYQMGGVGFYNNAIKRGVLVELEECKQAVKVYREQNPETVKFWYDTERCAIQAVKQRRTQDNPIRLRHLTFYLETLKGHTWLCIGLPSGRPIRYNQPEVRRVERFGKMQDQLSYRTEILGRWMRETTYGGKLCIAEGTLVLTKRGWVEIQNVVGSDVVWDGIGWVTTDGAVCNGVKPVIRAYNAWMTHDHLVLTDKGWKNASQSTRYNRAACRLPDGYAIPRLERQEIPMGRSLRLWQGNITACYRNDKTEKSWNRAFVWLQEKRDYFTKAAGKPTGITYTGPCHGVEVGTASCMDRYAGKVQQRKTPSMEKLWRSWHKGLQALGEVFPSFSGRYGAYLQGRSMAGAEGQQWQLHPSELRMGYATKTGQQPEKHSVHRGADDNGIRSETRTKSEHCRVQVETRVYDLVNCGPRNRFVIAAGDNPLIVHNCENVTQAVSRDVMAEAMQRAAKRGYPCVGTVHDELITEVAVEFGSHEELEQIMNERPKWAQDAPVNSEGWSGQRYRK